ncbi:UDP-glucose 4-epimerase GalE [Tannockella kyphosi]|uniref:UDP-glucose 4-epimerase GalE n=1 Tax=Tannockella kyphosi TaxID=2899121 RepID=UPI002011B0CB|nr:UDP-glucose 4-epimerase GalE [Tannockella kyphosi]
MKVLVTGGIGYIGSHTCVELLNQGHEVVIVDNLYNAKIEVLSYIKKITNKEVTFYEVDVCDYDAMKEIFAKESIDSIIHFAGYKAVGESVSKPVEYYTNNIYSTLILTRLMKEYDCKKFVFSSSATVYGDPDVVPIVETAKLGPTTNPYGTSKLMLEKILTDIQAANPDWTIILLRYFNPIGGHSSGLLGEDPKGIPNNLMPYIMKVANKDLACLGVFGDDYNTPDGTGVRDYIHVVDLGVGHVKALENIANDGVHIYNLGTGIGYSVLDVINTFEKVNGVPVPYKIQPRRAGDIAECYADSSKALEDLGWQATKTLEDMCKDAWNYVLSQK